MTQQVDMNDDGQLDIGNFIWGNRIKRQVRNFNEYTFFLDEPIGDPNKYREELHTLLSASENDSITFVINSPGGQLSTAASIIECIKNSEAQITALILQECSSAATMIALNCPNVIVSDSAEFMIHTGKFGTGGNANNVIDHVKFTVAQLYKLIDETYAGFLTVSEIEQVKIGVEFWFDAEETKRRFRNRYNYLQKREKQRLKSETKKS